MEQCAVREVEEECGLKQVSILSPLDTTLHIYYRNESWFLKKTYWYRMSAPSGQSFIPQTEEDIEEVLWYPIHNLSQLSNQTYPSLRDKMRFSFVKSPKPESPHRLQQPYQYKTIKNMTE